MKTPEEKLREWYAQDMGRRVSEGMREKAERGVMPGCAPVGYRNAHYAEDPIVVDGDLAPLVLEAFELAATGKYSLRKLLTLMTSKGLRSRNGKPMGVSALRLILTNPFYKGYIRHNGELLPGRHTAIVDDELFAETQSTLKGETKVAILRSRSNEGYGRKIIC